MKLAIVDPLGSPYSGDTPYKVGLGGSESAVVYISKELAKLGIKVSVFNTCTNQGYIDDVFYADISRLQSHLDESKYDVVISSRSVNTFLDYDFKDAYKVVWLHDTFCQGDGMLESMAVNNQIDEIWTLSDWHNSYVMNANHGHRRMMEVLKRKMWVTRNGINIWRDVRLDHKDHNRFIFNASVSKGMQTLLEKVWPRVYEATQGDLIIVGGAYNLSSPDEQNKELQRLQDLYNGRNGVHFTGIITQQQVANELSEASLMLYPQSNPETFGISTVESLAYGTPVISGRFGAMEETALDQACYLMDYPVDSNALYTFNEEAHVDYFVNMAINAWNNKYLLQQKANKALQVREVCGWDGIALEWKQHLYRKTGRYMSVSETRRANRITAEYHRVFGRRWSNPEEHDINFPEKERTIHVIVPYYNAEKYIGKCIESILAQDYDNYKVYVVDDASTDFSHVDVPRHDKILFHRNEKNVGALANQIMVIEDYITPHSTVEDIIVLVDGDDKLVNDPYIFKRINRLHKDGYEFTYGSCWSEADNIPLIAQEYPLEIVDEGKFREHKFPWNIPYTHLRTFSRDLYTRISDHDLRDSDGNFYKAGGDAALFYALVEAAHRDRIKAVRDVVYVYNDKNPINDYKINSEEQTANANAIRGHRKKILIAVPTDRNIHPQTFKSIYDLEIPGGFEADFQFFYGYRIDQIRNLIAHWAITGYDYLFAVDYDIAFDKMSLRKLLSVNTDIVTGIYRQRTTEKKLELYLNTPNGQFNMTPDMLQSYKEPFEVDACGFGCVLISKNVLEKIGYPQFEYHVSIDMKDTISEDVDFCNKAKEHGFTIKAHNDVICDHYGVSIYGVYD